MLANEVLALRAKIQVDERIDEAARLFAPRRTQLRNSRIAMFFLIAYAISWTAWITLFARHLPPFAWPGRWFYLAAVLGPHGAALVSTAVEGGSAELGAFYRRLTRQVPFRWAIAAICIPPIIYLVRDAMSVGFHLPHDSFFHRPPRTVMALVLGQLAVVLGEEPGWRGFALPRLVGRYGPIVGTLILGIAWAFWHLPLFIIPGTPQHGTGFLPFALELVAWSMIMTLIVIHARGTVVAAMLFHASANLCAFTMWQPDSQLFALGPWVVAAGIAAWRMQREFSRAPLTTGMC
jgi:membrane protease YdiL (CAAX protease family)